MIKVYVSWSGSEYNTWNVYDLNNKYIAHGNIFEIEQWLIDHKDTHEEDLTERVH